MYGQAVCPVRSGSGGARGSYRPLAVCCRGFYARAEGLRSEPKTRDLLLLDRLSQGAPLARDIPALWQPALKKFGLAIAIPLTPKP